jgi:hypothetical protein
MLSECDSVSAPIEYVPKRAMAGWGVGHDHQSHELGMASRRWSRADSDKAVPAFLPCAAKVPSRPTVV